RLVPPSGGAPKRPVVPPPATETAPEGEIVTPDAPQTTPQVTAGEVTSGEVIARETVPPAGTVQSSESGAGVPVETVP
ncbi:hypothetical protein C1885_26290, partial [Pseudomonas sp. GW531-R1]